MTSKTLKKIKLEDKLMMERGVGCCHLISVNDFQ